MNKKRLLKLADHLEKGKLGHKRFDFSQYNNVLKPECGTAGCAIGECPIVFPSNWKFDERGAPVLKRFRRANPVFQTINSGEIFFDLDDNEFAHLFTPEQQLPDTYGGKILTSKATRKQVAANIRAFVESKSTK